jgi:hypothetical protein
MRQVDERHGIELAVCRRICAMLGSRNISATLSGDNIRVTAARGCPHGGMPLPSLWSLVVDDLFWGLNKNGYYTVGYSDDIEILINRKFPQAPQRSYKEPYTESSSGTKKQSCLSTQIKR